MKTVQDGIERRFVWNKGEKELVFLRFDGIYMDSKVYVNGQMVREWKYGYSAFETEITADLVNGENEILVSADFQAPNSRWYSGAGIYRDVWIRRTPAEHFVADGIYFSAKKETDRRMEHLYLYGSHRRGQDLYWNTLCEKKEVKLGTSLNGIREREKQENGSKAVSGIRKYGMWNIRIAMN